MNHLNSFLQKKIVNFKWIVVELKKEGISCSKEGLNLCGHYGRKRSTFI